MCSNNMEGVEKLCGAFPKLTGQDCHHFLGGNSGDGEKHYDPCCYRDNRSRTEKNTPLVS